MTQIIQAVYAKGLLRPERPLEGVGENETVTLRVDAPVVKEFPFADWVGDMPDDEAREMMAVIDEEFGKVDPNEWK